MAKEKHHKKNHKPSKKKEEGNNKTLLWIGAAVVVIVLIILFAGKKAPEAPEAPVVPAPEPTPVDDGTVTPAEKPAEVVADAVATDKVIDKHVDNFVTDIRCDIEDKKVSFMLTNVASTEKVLRRVGQLEDASLAMRIAINGRRIRDLPTACGGIETLAPGESATCTKVFDDAEAKSLNYGILEGTNYDGLTTVEKKNRVAAHTQEVTDVKFFEC